MNGDSDWLTVAVGALLTATAFGVVFGLIPWLIQKARGKKGDEGE